MKSIIIATCITILLIASGFTSHEIKISTSEVTLTNTTVKIRIKLFADDLTSCLSQIAKKHIPFDGKTVDPKTMAILNDYVKQNFVFSINNTTLSYRFVISLIDNK